MVWRASECLEIGPRWMGAGSTSSVLNLSVLFVLVTVVRGTNPRSSLCWFCWPPPVIICCKSSFGTRKKKSRIRANTRPVRDALTEPWQMVEWHMVEWCKNLATKKCVFRGHKTWWETKKMISFRTPNWLDRIYAGWTKISVEMGAPGCHFNHCSQRGSWKGLRSMGEGEKPSQLKLIRGSWLSWEGIRFYSNDF